jgi:hypothetical protein
MTVSVSLRTSDKPDAASITFSASDALELGIQVISGLSLGENLFDAELLTIVREAELVVRSTGVAVRGLSAQAVRTDVEPTNIPTEFSENGERKTSEADVEAFQKRSQPDAQPPAAEPAQASVEPAEPVVSADPIDILLAQIGGASTVKEIGLLYGANKAVWSDPRVSSAAKLRAEALK